MEEKEDIVLEVQKGRIDTNALFKHIDKNLNIKKEVSGNG